VLHANSEGRGDKRSSARPSVGRALFHGKCRLLDQRQSDVVRWPPSVCHVRRLRQVSGQIADVRRGNGAAEQLSAVLGRVELDSEPVSSTVCPIWPNRKGRTK
jgi:hypothetical protein